MGHFKGAVGICCDCGNETGRPVACDWCGEPMHGDFTRCGVAHMYELTLAYDQIWRHLRATVPQVPTDWLCLSCALGDD